jgi:purine nucleosidase
LAAPVATAGHDFLAATLRKATSPLTVLVTGPCSNLAKVLGDTPDLAAQIQEVIWMGGALEVPGNVHDHDHDGSAEWNSYWDPPAGHRLWQTEAPITLFPLDVTNQVPITTKFFHRLAQQRRYPLSDLVGQCYAITAGTIPQVEYLYYMWDTLSTGYLGAPHLMKFRQLHTEIIPFGPSAGRIQAVAQGGKLTRAASAVDVAAFQEYFLDLLKSPVHQA